MVDQTRQEVMDDVVDIAQTLEDAVPPGSDHVKVMMALSMLLGIALTNTPQHMRDPVRRACISTIEGNSSH